MNRKRARGFLFLLLTAVVAGGFVSGVGAEGSRGPGGVQALQPTPELLAFADFPVGTPSAPQSVVILNAADLDLDLAGVTLAGAHPGDFALSADDCSGETLAPAASCSLEVVFQPTALGVRSAELRIGAEPFALRLAVSLSGTSNVIFSSGFESNAPGPNASPVADAGPDFDTGNGVDTTLDGSASFDPDGQPLTFLWTLAGPAGSTAALDDPARVAPRFTPDAIGDYLAALRVSDGNFISAPDSVAVRALPRITLADRVLPTYFTDDLALSLETAAGVGGLSIAIDNPTPSPVSVPATVGVAEGADAAAVPVESEALAGVVSVGASAPDYWPDQALVTVQSRTMTLQADPLVRIGGSNPASLVLDRPAPDGGIRFSLLSDEPGLVGAGPADVVVAAGETAAPITISGAAAGSAVVSAAAPGYAEATADVTATATTVDLAALPLLAIGDVVDLGVSLSEPAPVGGVTVELASSDAALLDVETTAPIAAGDTAPTAAPSASALQAGSVQVSVRAAGYAPDFVEVEVVEYLLTFAPDPVEVPAGWTAPATLTLTQPAPAGGWTIGLTSSNPAVFTVPASVIVPEGETSAGFDVTGVVPGSETLSAEGGFEVGVTVLAPPPITVQPLTLETFSSGLLTVELGRPARAGGVEVALVSDAPSVLDPPATALVPEGQSSIDVPVESGGVPGAATITASAADYTAGAGVVTVDPRTMGFDIDPLVGQGRSNPAAVVLDRPAPPGGVTVDLVSSEPAWVGVDPASVFIAAGETRGSFAVLGTLLGSATLTASAPGYQDAQAAVATTDVTVDLALAATLAVNDVADLGISLSQPAPVGGVVVEITSTAPGVLATDPDAPIAETATAPDVAPQATAIAIGTATVTVRADGYAPDHRTVDVVEFLVAFAPNPIAVPVGWVDPVTVTLSQPAPVGGRTLALTSSDESLFTVPASVTVPEGDTSAAFDLTGIAEGAGTLTASGGFEVPVTVLPPPPVTLDPLAIETFSDDVLTVRLGRPARAGGVVVSLSSDNPTVLDPPPTANIAEGFDRVDVPVQTGADAGSASISASAADYSAGSGTATVSLRTIGFDIDPLVAIGSTNPAEVVLDRPAPTGGVSVGLVSSDPTLVSVTPASVFIAEGDQRAPFSVTGEIGGTVVITASAVGYADADVTVGSTSDTVSVGEVPDMTPGKSVSLPISLSEPAPAGGTTIVLESAEPGIATVEASVFIAEGDATPPTNPQVTGVSVGTTVITARAEGFAPDSRTATVSPFRVSLSPNPLQVFEGWTRSIGVTLSDSAPIGGLELTLVEADESLFTAPPTVLVGEGQTTASFEITGVSTGASTLTVSGPDTESAVFDVEIDPRPNISMGDLAVGKDLQDRHLLSLRAAPNEPTDVTVTVAEESTALLSLDPATPGAKSITFTGVQNTNSLFFYVQGLAEGQTEITATADGFNSQTSTVSVTPSGFHLVTGDFSTTTFSANSTIDVRLYRLRDDGLRLSQQELRAGAAPVAVEVLSSNSSVGAITSSPLTFTPDGGSRRTTGFTPLSAGTTTVSIVHPAGFTEPSNGRISLTATVTD